MRLVGLIFYRALFYKGIDFSFDISNLSLWIFITFTHNGNVEFDFWFSTRRANCNPWTIRKSVLKYTLADGFWIVVRPSGTEPKIKFYIAVVGESNEDSQAKIANIEAEINAFVK